MKWPDPADLIGISDHQRERLGKALSSQIGILGGNPGAGKSYCAAKVIGEVAAHYGAGAVAVCAPTGKAAVRITEAMLGHGITGIEATTIHRLLGVTRNGHDGNGWGFEHDQLNPLQEKFLFIDEASMLGTGLAASLLGACTPETHILFIGDFGQLPPVEHGAPLRDMIDAGIAYGELEEIHRNAGDIVLACRDLKAGKAFTPSPRLDLDCGHNLKHIEAARPPIALGHLRQLIESAPASMDRVWDIQVLCAVNEKSELSRKNLNRMLQELLNPRRDAKDGRFSIGDKVICLTNCFLPVVGCGDCLAAGCGGGSSVSWNGKYYVCDECYQTIRLDGMAHDFVANGEIGQVTELLPRAMHVRFNSPSRTVRVSGEWLDQFDLAYAITCHKSQGSQWPVVIVLADDFGGADFVTSREWWRTALSRAEKVCFTIGKKSTIDRQARQSALAQRKTFLRERLTGAFGHDAR